MPNTRVWVKQGLDSHRSTQVLLVPLGNIPPDVYSKYCEILRRFRYLYEVYTRTTTRTVLLLLYYSVDCFHTLFLWPCLLWSVAHSRADTCVWAEVVCTRDYLMCTPMFAPSLLRGVVSCACCCPMLYVLCMYSYRLDSDTPTDGASTTNSTTARV